MIRLAWFLGVASMCIACTQRNHMLHELPSIEVQVSVTRSIDEVDAAATPPRVAVELGYNTERFRELYDGDCASLEDIKGEYPTLADEHTTSGGFDDVPLALVDPGGVDEASGDCRLPRFEVDGNADAHSEEIKLWISDGQATVRAYFYRAFLRPRYAILTSHDAWSFAPGDVVTWSWSHPQETYDAFEVRLEGDTSATLGTVQPSSVDASFSITIPSPAPTSGDAMIDIVGGKHLASGTAASCYGAASCRWSVPPGYRHRATIE